MTRTDTGSDPRAARRKLPVGIQTFRTIREDGCYYVDKTAYVQRLADEGEHHFLSRPRRFCESLLLDTIKELFEGRRRPRRRAGLPAGVSEPEVRRSLNESLLRALAPEPSRWSRPRSGKAEGVEAGIPSLLDSVVRSAGPPADAACRAGLAIGREWAQWSAASAGAAQR